MPGIPALMATGGIGAALAAAFSQVRNALTSFRAAFICVTTFDGVGANAFLHWSKEQKLFLFGDTTYFITQNNQSSKISMKATKAKFRDKFCVCFLPFPTILKYNSNNSCVQITYLRFTVNPDKVCKELFQKNKEWMTSRISQIIKEGDNSYCKDYSNIFFVNGTLGNQGSNSAGDSMPNGGKIATAAGEQDRPSDGISEGKQNIQIWKHTEAENSEIVDNFEYNFKCKSAFDLFYYDEEINVLIDEIKRWKSLRQWYTEMGLPWKRGVCLYGPPGTGKTSLIRNISRRFGMDIYVFNLSTFKDSEFLNELEYRARLCSSSDGNPVFFLFEDIDVVFNGRENSSKNTTQSPLTFSTFINGLDGVKELNGIYFAITTNKLEKLDSAIIRPGRIDGCYQVKPFGRIGQQKLAEAILSDWPEEIEKVVTDDLVTGAEFKNKCLKIAMKRKWEDMAVVDVDKVV